MKIHQYFLELSNLSCSSTDMLLVVKTDKTVLPTTGKYRKRQKYKLSGHLNETYVTDFL